MASTFAQRSMFAVTALVLSVGDVMAASKGAAGFTKATQEVSSYQEPVSNLMAVSHSLPCRKPYRCSLNSYNKYTTAS